MPKNFPAPQGLYDSALEKDSCGVGFVCHIKGTPSNQILRDAEPVSYTHLTLPTIYSV